MIKSLLIALTLVANQPITLDVAFDLGYKVGMLTCKFIVPGQIDSNQALAMAVESLPKEEKEIVLKLNQLDPSLPIAKVHAAGYRKAITNNCLDTL